ncbi:hypothetical protein STEG23_035842, partial [Scotinomys teguina]
MALVPCAAHQGIEHLTGAARERREDRFEHTDGEAVIRNWFLSRMSFYKREKERENFSSRSDYPVTYFSYSVFLHLAGWNSHVYKASNLHKFQSFRSNIELFNPFAIDLYNSAHRRNVHSIFQSSIKFEKKTYEQKYPRKCTLMVTDQEQISFHGNGLLK